MADWNHRYRQGERTIGEPHPLVVEYSAKLAPGRGLDLACGPGRHALWLAERGWHVTAVDSSEVAIEILWECMSLLGVNVDARIADLECGEFTIDPDHYDLVVVTCYLQRDLFQSIRAGVRPGGLVLAVIAMVDDDPHLKPMNPAFLLQPGELRSQFVGWELLHDVEAKAAQGKRAMAEVVARKKV